MNLKTIPCVLALCSISSLGMAAESLEQLKQAFGQASRSLDEAISEYGRERSREKNAISEFRRLSQQLDDTIDDPNVSLSYLNRLEDELTVARDRACSQADTTARARREMYFRMQSLGDLARQFERETGLLTPDEVGLAGMWQIETTPNNLVGLLNLRVSGTQVSGPYRLNNGNRGSVRGSVSGDRVELEVVDSEEGVVGTIKGEVDRSAGEIRGTWLALIWGGFGEPATGDWFATRLSDEEGFDLGF